MKKTRHLIPLPGAMDRLAHLIKYNFGAQVLIAYVLFLIILAVVRLFVHVNPYDFASSPLGLKHGRVWQLISSGFLVEGNPLWQIPLLALGAGMVTYRYGAKTFWKIAALGHIGGTVVVYAAYAALYFITLTPKVLELGEPDYGISLVWSACLGALAISGMLSLANDRFRWLDVGLTIFSVGVFLTLLPYELRLIGFEHVFSFVLGAAAIALLTLKAELSGRELRQA